jgi:hypothetical protein
VDEWIRSGKARIESRQATPGLGQHDPRKG